MEFPLPLYYDRYIKLCNDVSLKEAFDNYTVNTVFEEEKLTQLADKVYEENKWTVKQIIQHCIDTERIMTYRAMRFARYDETELPGFNENVYAKNAPVNHLSLEDLLHEFALLRDTTTLFFNRLNKSQLSFSGIASGIDISTEHLGYTLIGHAVHHQNILRERYYPLI